MSTDQAPEEDVEFLTLSPPVQGVSLRLSTPLTLAVPDRSDVERGNLLSLSDDWVVATGDTDFKLFSLKSLYKTLASSTPHSTPETTPHLLAPSHSPGALITHVAFSTSATGDAGSSGSDTSGTNLIVATSDGSIALYFLSELAEKLNPTPYFASNPSPHGNTIIGILPCPTPASPLVLILNSNDPPTLLTLPSSPSTPPTFTTPFPSSLNGAGGTVTSASWSVKGKQVVLGFSNGQIGQFTPEGAQKGAIDLAPSLAGEGGGMGTEDEDGFEVRSLSWLENTVFLVVYAKREVGGDRKHEDEVFIVTKGTDATLFTRVEDPTPAFGMMERKGQRWVSRLGAWTPFKHLLFLANSPSGDIGVLGQLTSPDNASSPPHWATLTLPDASRPSLPLTPEGTDTCPLGLQVALGGVDSSDGAGGVRLLVYTSEGVLVVWGVENEFGGNYLPRSATTTVATTTASSTPPITAFGAPAFGSSGSPFGAPAFASAATKQVEAPPMGAFGAPAFAATPAFGARPAFGSNSGFGAPAFGTPAAATPPPATTSGNAFGAFGSSTPSAFGVSTSSSSGGGFAGFGGVSTTLTAAAPATPSPAPTAFSAFGNAATGFGASTAFPTSSPSPAAGASPFGSGSSFGAAPAFGSSPSAAPASTGFNFGPTASTVGPSPFSTTASSTSTPSSLPSAAPKSAFGAAGITGGFGGFGAPKTSSPLGGTSTKPTFSSRLARDSSDNEEEDDDIDAEEEDDDGQRRVDEPPDLEPTMTNLDIGAALASAPSSKSKVASAASGEALTAFGGMNILGGAKEVEKEAIPSPSSLPLPTPPAPAPPLAKSPGLFAQPPEAAKSNPFAFGGPSATSSPSLTPATPAPPHSSAVVPSFPQESSPAPTPPIAKTPPSFGFGPPAPPLPQSPTATTTPAKFSFGPLKAEEKSAPAPKAPASIVSPPTIPVPSPTSTPLATPPVASPEVKPTTGFSFGLPPAIVPGATAALPSPAQSVSVAPVAPSPSPLLLPKQEQVSTPKELSTPPITPAPIPQALPIPPAPKVESKSAPLPFSFAGLGTAAPAAALTPAAEKAVAPSFTGHGLAKPATIPKPATPAFGGFGTPTLAQKQSEDLAKPKAAPAKTPFSFGLPPATFSSASPILKAASPVEKPKPSSSPFSMPSSSSNSGFPAQHKATPPPAPAPVRRVEVSEAPIPKLGDRLAAAPTPKVSEAGMTGEFLKAFLLLEQEFKLLRENTAICKSFVRDIKQPRQADSGKLTYDGRDWSMGDLENLSLLSEKLAPSVGTVVDVAQQQKRQVAELQSQLLKAETKREEAARFIRAQSDPVFAKMVRVRQLGPEQIENQKKIRIAVETVRTRVEQVEEHLIAVKSKLSEQRLGRSGFKAPSLDSVNRAVRNITAALTEKNFEIDDLNLRLDALRIGPSSPLANFRRHRSPSLISTLGRTTPNGRHSPSPGITSNASSQRSTAPPARLDVLKAALKAVHKGPLYTTPKSATRPGEQISDLQLAFASGPITGAKLPRPRRPAPPPIAPVVTPVTTAQSFAPPPAATPSPSLFSRLSGPPTGPSTPAAVPSFAQQPAATPSWSMSSPPNPSPGAFPIFKAPTSISFGTPPAFVPPLPTIGASSRGSGSKSSRQHTGAVQLRAPAATVAPPTSTFDWGITPSALSSPPRAVSSPAGFASFGVPDAKSALPAAPTAKPVASGFSFGVPPPSLNFGNPPPLNFGSSAPPLSSGRSVATVKSPLAMNGGEQEVEEGSEEDSEEVREEEGNEGEEEEAGPGDEEWGSEGEGEYDEEGYYEEEDDELGLEAIAEEQE